MNQSNGPGLLPDRRFVLSDVGVVMWCYNCCTAASSFPQVCAVTLRWVGVGLGIGVFVIGCKVLDGWEAIFGNPRTAKKEDGP